ncbi:MAG: hypothetical protein SV765_01075 [Pseudomonadota bacterium]|nr:hypothetical protein [Pseudomonadales bacterium]MDY6918784.1 hypothetical protein [Pseudomonadota bacterium]
MQYDAQIQMIVSTFKLSQTLEVDPESGKASLRFALKCHGGARSASFAETQAEVNVREATRLNGKYLGTVVRHTDGLLIRILAPRDYFHGLIQLFPHCEPDSGGYLSFDFLLNRGPDGEGMQVLSAEYKMVKQLSDNPDLISRAPS